MGQFFFVVVSLTTHSVTHFWFATYQLRNITVNES